MLMVLQDQVEILPRGHANLTSGGMIHSPKEAMLIWPGVNGPGADISHGVMLN